MTGKGKQPTKNKTIGKSSREKYILRLYVVGKTPNCMRALRNLEKICEQYLPKQYRIQVIDLLLFPHLAKEDQIMAIPTVIRKLPTPIRKAIGDLSNMEDVLLGLDIHPVTHKKDQTL